MIDWIVQCRECKHHYIRNGQNLCDAGYDRIDRWSDSGFCQDGTPLNGVLANKDIPAYSEMYRKNGIRSDGKVFKIGNYTVCSTDANRIVKFG